MSQNKNQINSFTLFYRHFDFLSDPGVADEILENEHKSCFLFSFMVDFTRISENFAVFEE